MSILKQICSMIDFSPKEEKIKTVENALDLPKKTDKYSTNIIRQSYI